MPELSKIELYELLPQVLSTLSPLFDGVSCELVDCPNLSQSPFNLPTVSFGQLIYIVPDSISQDEAIKQIVSGKLVTSTNGFHVVSDGKHSIVLSAILERRANNPTPDWKTPLRNKIEKILGANWEFLCAELRPSLSHSCSFYLLKSSTTVNTKDQECQNAGNTVDETIKLWLVPISRRIVAGCTKRIKRKKTSSKSNSKTPPKEAADENPLSTGMGSVNGEIIHTLQNDTDKPTTAVDTTKLEVETTFFSLAATDKVSQDESASKVERTKRTLSTTLNGINKLTEPILNQPTGKLCPTKSPHKVLAKDAELAKADSQKMPCSLVENKITGEYLKTSQGVLSPTSNHPINKTTSNSETPDIPLKNGVSLKASETESNNNIFGIVLKPIDANKQADTEENSCQAKPLLEISIKESNSEDNFENINHKTELTSSDAANIAINAHSSSDDEYHSLNNSNRSSPPNPKEKCDLTNGMNVLNYQCSPQSFTATNKQQPSSSVTLSASTQALLNSVRRPIILNGLSTRLLPPNLAINKLSPISSCDSLPDENDGTKIRMKSDDLDDDEETLNLLNNDGCSSLRQSADRDDDRSDVLDLSLQDDISSYSTCTAASNWEPQESSSRKFSSERPSTFGTRLGTGTYPTTVGTSTMIVREKTLSPAISSYASSSTATLISSAPNSSRKSSLQNQTMGQPSQQHHRQQVNLVRGMPLMSVAFLQQVLSKFSYKELGELRRVHPHWDELCGQRLNSGYYKLIQRADELLAECQRRIYNEKHLAGPTKVLTNFHLNVLNPVDALRAVIDEGIVCFPYGLILDKAFDLLNNIENTIKTGVEESDLIYECEKLALLSHRAQRHYRQFVEPEAEKRMNEVCRISAAQQLQRLDSFLMEANVTKIEKNAEKAREDMKWEFEQLKTQNQQLKKDNRELKTHCQRLDQRVDVLERKFKTISRLLQ